MVQFLPSESSQSSWRDRCLCTGHCKASSAQSKEDKLRADETESGQSVNADCGDRGRLPITHCVSHHHCPALIT